jgi:hypothetical protein
MEVPANSPLRSAPLIPGTMYKDIDTGMCVGRFDESHTNYDIINNRKLGPYTRYFFTLINHNYASEIAGNNSVKLKPTSEILFTIEENEVLKHNLIEAKEGQCGVPYKSLPSAVGATYNASPKVSADQLPSNWRYQARVNGNVSWGEMPGGGRRRKSRRNKNRNRKNKSRRNRH